MSSAAGVISDAGRIDVAGVRVLVVPADARVIAVEGDGVDVCMEKRVGLVRRPADLMLLRTARRAMGVAFQVEGTSLRLGTYGEWRHIEGSARLSLTIRVPSTLLVDRADSLSGPDSAAANHELNWWSKHRRNDRAWWAAPVPAAGWTGMETKPACRCSARAGLARAHLGR